MHPEMHLAELRCTMITIQPDKENVMKKTIILVLMLLGLSLTSQALAIPSLQFNAPGPYTVAAGDNLSVSLDITNLGGQIVSAFDLNVLYNPSVLSANVVMLNSVPLMGGADTFWNVDFSNPGNLNVWVLSLLTNEADIAALQSPYNGTFSLFTMGFTALADGTTDLALGPLSVADGKDVKGYSNEPIIPTNPIPEPSTIALVALGLVGVAAARRFKRQ
jgi:hypothetical protein